MTITAFEADDLTIRLTVGFLPGSDITSLVGAVVEARARSTSGATIPATSCVVTGPNGLVAVFADGVLDAGIYTLQIRATVSGITQTIAEKTIEVRRSIRRNVMSLLAGGAWSDAGQWNDSGAWRA